MVGSVGVRGARIAVAMAFVAGGVVWTSGVARATDPTFVQFPAAVDDGSGHPTPGRLYMAPAGSVIPGSIGEFVGLPVGTLAFDGGTDLISQRVRAIEIGGGDDGCDPHDDADDSLDWLLTGCAHIQLDVTGGDVGSIDEYDNGIAISNLSGPTGPPSAGQPAGSWFQHSGGAFVTQIQNDAAPTGPQKLIWMDGTIDEINAALDDLTYVADPDGYRYIGTNPVTLHVIAETGDDTGAPSISGDIEIRVLDVNGFPSIAGPASPQGPVIPGAELVLTDQYTVEDDDNDEDTDGDQADPPVTEEPLVDGANDEMMLIALLSCGKPILPGTGVHFASSSFQSDNLTIDDFLIDLIDGTPLDTDGFDTYVDAVLAALDAIDPTLGDIELATSDETTFTSAFAGVSTMSEIRTALSEVTFRHDQPDDTCTLLTVVTDLGNNGLPLQYIVTDPAGEDPGNSATWPFGWEAPMIGFDWHEVTFTTDSVQEITIDFDVTPIVIGEPSSGTGVAAALHISPAIHPEFEIGWEINPKNGEPEVTGIATAGSDFLGRSNTTFIVPADATLVDLSTSPALDLPETNVFPDGTPEPTETFTFDLVLDAAAPPVGYALVSDVPSRTVVIVDDDGGPLPAVSIADATVAEGLAGTTDMVFTLTLDGVASGTETVMVDTSNGPAPAATGGTDYTALTGVTATFTAGSDTTTVVVPIVDDPDVEPDERFTVTLSSPTGLTIDDGVGVGTIADDDIEFTADPTASVAENSSSTFAVQISPSQHPGFTLVALLVPGTATGGDDYDDSGSPFVVAVPADATTVDVPIAALGDLVVDDGETYTVHLEVDTDPPGFMVHGTTVTVVTIDDVAPANSVLSLSDVTVAEGDPAMVPANNSFPARVCPVAVSTTPVSAVSPDDYVAISGSAFDLNGADSIDVTTVDDDDIEADETFLVNITLIDPPPPGCVIGDGEAVVTITSDDVPMEISIDDGAVAEGAMADLAVHVTNPVSPYCAVTVTTAGVTATSGSDFAEIAGVGFDANGVDPITVEALQDLDDDDAETFTVTLTLEAGADPRCVIADGQATVTIIDDDGPVDDVPPTVTIDQAAGQPDPTNTGSVEFTVVFSEPVIGFTEADVALSGSANPLGAVVTGASPGTTFSVLVSPINNPGLVIADVVAGGAIDLAGNPNLASTSTDNQVTFDLTGPTVTIDQAATQDDPTATSPILFTIVFSEPVVGFATGDVTLGGTAGATTAVVSGSGASYTVAVSGMTQDGTVIASIAAGVATDAATNPNGASTSVDNAVTFDVDEGDVTAPSVTVEQSVGQPDPTATSPILFTVTFSEPVTGFSTGDVTLSGSAGATTAVVSGSGAVYSVAVSGMTQDGTVRASVAAGRAQDAAANPNLASTSVDNTVTFDVDEGDVTAPTVTIDQAATQPDPTNVEPVRFTVVFSEPVTGFTAADLLLDGTAGPTSATVSGSGTTYAVSVTGMPGPGTVVVTIPPGAAMDAALNPSAASTSSDNVVTYDPSIVLPITLNLPGDLTTGTDPGAAGAVVTWPEVTAAGGVPPVTVVCTRDPGDFFPIGTTVVSCTATDSEATDTSERFVEATVTGTFSVTVIDDERPVIAQPPNIARTATSSLGAVVTFATPTATDNAGAPTVSCTPTSGTRFSVGTRTVTCTATDPSGNTATASFTVTVTRPTSGVPTTGADTGASLALALALLAFGLVLRIGARRRSAA